MRLVLSWELSAPFVDCFMSELSPTNDTLSYQLCKYETGICVSGFMLTDLMVYRFRLRTYRPDSLQL